MDGPSRWHNTPKAELTAAHRCRFGQGQRKEGALRVLRMCGGHVVIAAGADADFFPVAVEVEDGVDGAEVEARITSQNLVGGCGGGFGCRG